MKIPTPLRIGCVITTNTKVRQEAADALKQTPRYLVEPLLDRILTLNLAATTEVFYVAAKIYLLPRLDQLSARTVMIPILLLHSLRQLGLMFLTRGATYPGLPREFAWPAAVGDLVAALLAFISVFVVLRDWTRARPF